MGFLFAAMPRAPITRLREQRTPGPVGAEVIDAEFKVVGRRTRLAAIRRGLIALCAAAAIGFLIPPVWVLVQNLGEVLGR
ncbi:MAG TPA: hypothetical protein DHW63_04210 [Hyphomonadaceae bacterium]|nr:hypothetical protein [Hyphomonadaceae bacterium]